MARHNLSNHLDKKPIKYLIIKAISTCVALELKGELSHDIWVNLLGTKSGLWFYLFIDEANIIIPIILLAFFSLIKMAFKKICLE